MEIWKKINNHNDYEISSFGRVRSFKLNKERILKAGVGSSGYYNVVLDKKTKRVHQLVAIAFLNHKPNGFELVINHKDRNRLNNNLDNLEIVTQRENTNFKNKKTTSIYTGVCFIKKRNKWRANISLKNKKIFLGDFFTENEANEFYKNALHSIKNNLPIKTKPVIKKSNYKGVTWNESRKRWVSRITINKIVFCLGYFKDEKKAGELYLNSKKNYEDMQTLPISKKMQ